MISSSPYYSHVSALLHQFAADTDFTSRFASVFGVEITPDAFVAVLSALPIIEVLSLCKKSGQRPRVANQGEYPNEQKNATNIYR